MRRLLPLAAGLRRTLIKNSVTSRKDFGWLQCMRFYFTHPTSSGQSNPQGLLKVCMADASFDYGFEYLGEPIHHLYLFGSWLSTMLVKYPNIPFTSSIRSNDSSTRTRFLTRFGCFGIAMRSHGNPVVFLLMIHLRNGRAARADTADGQMLSHSNTGTEDEARGEPLWTCWSVASFLFDDEAPFRNSIKKTVTVFLNGKADAGLLPYLVDRFLRVHFGVLIDWVALVATAPCRLCGVSACSGTGKTESVKALGSALGRYTLVFNCDETFDFNAMGRLFSGLCQVGAWGCFDEFNRLDERILSAVSEQILTIQVLSSGLCSLLRIFLRMLHVVSFFPWRHRVSRQ